MSSTDYMLAAIQLAKKGWPQALPNPMVGCLIVQDGQIVASGYHTKFGAAHAEVEAINQLPSTIAASECTVYVTLEPCSHFGKTPPCADLLIAKGFKKIVIARLDPNPLVAGRGVERLRAAGIAVEIGLCDHEARALNVRFFTFHEKKRPYIILKWAQSADGFISRVPVPVLRSENMITGVEAQKYAHVLRAQVQGILVGKNTVLADDPALTLRHAAGVQPLRIVIDRRLEIPKSAAIFDSEATSLIVNEIKIAKEENIEYLQIEFNDQFLPQLLTRLHSKGIQSLLVEGGAILLESFLKAELWDEVQIFENPTLIISKGIKAPEFEKKTGAIKLGKDLLFRWRKQENGSNLSPFSGEIAEI